MTVPTSDNREEYTGNDATTSFDYAFKIFEDSDLQVYLQAADGTETLLVLNTDYSVSGAGDLAGGSVTYPLSGDPLASDEKLVIIRVLEVVQETDLRNQGAYYPQVVEDEFDRSRMIDQQQQEELDRSLKRPAAEDGYDADGRQIKSGAEATDGDDFVIKNQMDSRFSTDVITKTSGRWDAKGLRMTSLQTSDTPQPDEAVNRQHMEAYFNSVVLGGGPYENLRSDLAKNTAGDGSDLVLHTGTADTVTEALDKRTIYVGSVAEIEALSLAVGANVYLAEKGRAGSGTVKAGAAPSDTYGGIYVDLASGNHWERDDKTRLTPEMFGVIGDSGGPDDGPRLAEMFRLALVHGSKVEGRASAVYRIASDVEVAMDELQSLFIDFKNATLRFENAGLFIDGPVTADGPYLETGFTSNPEAGDRSVLLSSTTGVAPGDLMFVFSPAISSGSTNVYHYYVVRAVEGSEVWVDGYIEADINPQQVIDDGQTGSITVSFYKMSDKVTFENALLRVDAPTVAQDQTVRIRGIREIDVNAVSCDGKARNQIYLQQYGYARVTGGAPINAGYFETPDQGYSSDPASPDGLSFGYGIIVARGYSCDISGVFGRRAWHVVDVSRGAMKTVIRDSALYNSAYAISTHEGAWDVDVRNSNFYSGSGALLTRNVSSSVKGCKFLYPTFNAIAYSNSMRKFVLTDNEFYVDMDKVGNVNASFLFRSNSASSPAGITSANRKRLFVARDNTFECNALGFNCDLGFVDSFGTGIFKNNNFINVIGASIFCPEFTDISGNTINSASQYGLSVFVYKETGSINITNNKGLGEATGSLPALFRLTATAGDFPVSMNYNRCDFGRIVRCNDSNVTIRRMAFNDADGQLLQGADSTFVVTTAAKNVYRAGLILGSGTITNDLDNVIDPAP